MKHFIIAKFRENIDWKALVPEITSHFEAARSIDGISDVIIHTSCSNRSNRFHIMIELQMTPSGLENFDKSAVHSEWKAKYGDMLEGKTIFDCE